MNHWVFIGYAFGISLWYLGAILLCREQEDRDRYTAVSVIWPIVAVTALGWWIVSIPRTLKHHRRKGFRK